MYRIRSKPKRLLWYHKVVIALAAVIVSALVVSVIWIFASGGFRWDNCEYIFDLFVALVFAGGYLHRELVGEVLYDYDAFSLAPGRTKLSLAVPFEFKRLSRVLRRAPECVILQAPSEEEGFELQSDNGGLKTNELTIRGNEDDLDHLCKSIKDAGIDISDDGMGDDPPDRIVALLTFVMLTLAITCYVLYRIAGVIK